MCGTPSPSKIAGRENISTEFTLTNNVIVTDDNMITDSENMVKPVTANTPQTGYVVLTIRHDKDIPYIGSVAETYDISGFQLPGDYNKALPVTMLAEYNDKANTPTSLFSETITIKLSIISYRAVVNLKLQQNNLEPAKLYDLVWKEVKQQFNDDSQVSSDYNNDYKIDWSTVIEPNIGGNTELNF